MRACFKTLELNTFLEKIKDSPSLLLVLHQLPSKATDKRIVKKTHTNLWNILMKEASCQQIIWQ